MAYYNIAALDRLQLGAQAPGQIILFMTRMPPAKFRRSRGWKASMDNGVALATLGRQLDRHRSSGRSRSSACIFSNKGLMYNPDLRGLEDHQAGQGENLSPPLSRGEGGGEFFRYASALADWSHRRGSPAAAEQNQMRAAAVRPSGRPARY
ncbi:MAG: hypothetical protein M5R42_01915 [Rhodocyclaceae bacterium]|nr:hypothetical protein [Rhodocyclaceae bacterium]